MYQMIWPALELFQKIGEQPCIRPAKVATSLFCRRLVRAESWSYAVWIRIASAIVMFHGRISSKRRAGTVGDAGERGGERNRRCSSRLR